MKTTTVKMSMTEEIEFVCEKISIGGLTLINDSITNQRHQFCTPNSDGLELDKVLRDLKMGDRIKIIFIKTTEIIP